MIRLVRALAGTPLHCSRNAEPLRTLLTHGVGLSEGNCHDHDRQNPSKDARTPDSVGSRRARYTLLDSVVADARCAQFRGSGSGKGAKGSPR